MTNELTAEYLESLRNTSGEQKLRTAFQLYWSARRLKAAFLQQRYPDWSTTQIDKEVSRIFSHARN